MEHQFNLFRYKETKPVMKVPISEARIREAKALLENGDGRGAAIKMREIRERLEDFERKISNAKTK